MNNEKFKIENPHDARELAKKFYSALYLRQSQQSPDKSRDEIRGAIMLQLRAGHVNPMRIWDIGSGAQWLERELMARGTDEDGRKLLQDVDFITTDIADIQKGALMGSRHRNIRHIQADVAEPRFPENSFGMVVSNLALDIAPREALKNVAAALVPGGPFAITLNHPDTLREILAGEENEELRAVVRYGLEQGFFYRSIEEIRTEFEKQGLTDISVKVRSANNPFSLGVLDRWWSVKGSKTNRQAAVDE